MILRIKFSWRYHETEGRRIFNNHKNIPIYFSVFIPSSEVGTLFFNVIVPIDIPTRRTEINNSMFLSFDKKINYIHTMASFFSTLILAMSLKTLQSRGHMSLT